MSVVGLPSINKNSKIMIAFDCGKVGFPYGWVNGGQINNSGNAGVRPGL